jgi:hypothetical protein
MATQTKKTKETKMLTARELADKAGISPTVLRSLLRKEFNRAGKTLVEGNRAEYRFNPNDAVTKQIIARAKALKESPPEPQKESNTEPQQNS